MFVCTKFRGNVSRNFVFRGRKPPQKVGEKGGLLLKRLKFGKIFLHDYAIYLQLVLHFFFILLLLIIIIIFVKSCSHLCISRFPYIYTDNQRWSPRGHILKSLASKFKSLALASRPQVLENRPVLGSRTALFFELLKFCGALKNFFEKRFFVRSLEKNF